MELRVYLGLSKDDEKGGMGLAMLDPEGYFHSQGSQLRLLEHTASCLFWQHRGRDSLLYVGGGGGLKAEQVLRNLTLEQRRYIDYVLLMDMPSCIRVLPKCTEGVGRKRIALQESYLTVFAQVPITDILRSRAAKGPLWRHPVDLWSRLERDIRLRKAFGLQNEDFWVQGKTWWSLSGRIATFGSDEERLINPVVQQCF